MKILVIGMGGREHAIVWKIAQSPLVELIYCVPGNSGISDIAECPHISLEDDFSHLADFAETRQIDLAIVGPEAHLANGLVNVFQARGLRVFGPTQQAAIIEASKDFAKNLMIKNSIPTADHQTFVDADAAISYVKSLNQPVFVKADGLAAGKGAIPGRTVEEAVTAINRILVHGDFGIAGSKVIIEELMVGEEASFTVLTDGDYCLPLATAQDHKMSHDGDQGENTGGMGAYSPTPVITKSIEQEIMETIVYPTIHSMKTEGREFKGVLYVGLMITKTGPKVVEFNVRLGDPETQVLLPRLASDLVPLLNACVDGNLNLCMTEWKPETAVCTIMASGGYPSNYETGKVIRGIDDADALNDVVVFQAGTKRINDKIVTDGGRVLGVTALGIDVKSSIDLSYQGVEKINFDRAHYRRDIGYHAINRK
jgi:phosphoribosylamine--glycine ligase